MKILKLDDLKDNTEFTEHIRWNITPKLFLDPSSVSGDEPADISYGFMLYVDLVDEKPTLVIMQLKKVMSKTVGYIYNIPEKLLKESMHCSSTECVAGMYPLGKSLEDWLKKEMGLA